MAWSFCVTALILFIINKIPGLHLRAEEVDEKEGLDKAELGQSMYEHIDELKSASTLTQLSNNDGDTINHNVKPANHQDSDNKINGRNSTLEPEIETNL